MENGTAVGYPVVNQGIPSGSSLYDSPCDGTWLLRKDIYEERQWHSSNVNDYANSTIHSYLNSTFLTRFDSDIQDAIKQVKTPYVNGTGSNGSVASSANGLSAKIFLLSGYEVGFLTSVSKYVPVAGAKLDFFESGITNKTTRIAYLNGTAINWWLRSPYTEYTNYVWFVYTNGGSNYRYCSDSYGVRPALVLPSTAVFDKDTLVFKGVK